MATWKTIIVKFRKETVDISDIQHDEGDLENLTLIQVGGR